MDYKKLYSPMEATALYNTTKIKFDPTSYSLKGNLITSVDRSDISKEHIGYFNYDTEYILTRAINDYEKKRPAPNGLSGMSKATGTPNLNSDVPLLFVQQDNLYICLDILKELVTLKDIKSTNVMQTLVYMCVALNSTKSCSKEIEFLSLHQTSNILYDKLHSFEYLKENLKAKASINLLSGNQSVHSTIVPSYTGAASIKNAFLYHSSDMVDTIYANLIASFEVLWAVNKLPIELRECFYELCRKTSTPVYTFDLFEDIIEFNGTGFHLDSDLEKIIAIDNPEHRYNEYVRLVNKNYTKWYKQCGNYYSFVIPKLNVINPIFAAFTSFVLQLSEINIRINTIRILYEYCKTHGYLDEDLEDSEEYSTLSKFTEILDASSTSESCDTSKPLLDLDEGKRKYSGSKEPVTDCPDTSSAMFEALDKIKSSFKSGIYKFDTEDIIDTSDTYKVKYNAIANKVELVNKLLIKRIKNIKTYNVGGKNPGMSSGRVDRKAIYRYKYDPNIFYNNTYKTLENDLAFGIILDESGSMCGRGIQDGRISMVVLHETLKALGINHSIIGHTSSGKHHCKIARYQAFKEDKTYSTGKNYALIKANAKAGNCDSGALYYMEKAFDRVRNKDKICLIFSDGEPTECSGTELKNQVKAMEKKNIKVIGIGINFASIAKYYTDYANGRNLADMLNIIGNILEQYVLKKKEK